MSLLDDPAALQELFDHLKLFEGDVPHFYFDSENLITIAIGELVDRRNVVLALRRAVAVTFAHAWHAHFLYAGASIATAAHVLADWDQVAALPLGSRSRAMCQSKCQCRLPTFAARKAIALRKVTTFYNALVATPRAFMAGYHAKIQMALVDTRYNPGIPMYESSGDIGRMWNALNPSHALYDPLHARDIFARIWRGVKSGSQRYQNRVSWRLARFDEGLAHGAATRTPVWQTH